MKIPLELYSLTHQKLSKVYDAFVELTDERFHYKVEFKAEEPIDNEDDSLGWEKVNTFWERVVLKNRICGCELEYLQATKRNKNEKNIWRVTVNMTGYNDDVKIYFEDQQKAQELFYKVFNWIFNELPKPSETS